MKIETKVNKHTFTIAFALYSLCQFNARSAELEKLTIGLPDGVYLIERVIYAPPRYFDREKDAKAFLQETKTNPGAITPQTEYFKSYVSKQGFVLHQLKQIRDGEYQPNGNLLASVSQRAYWAFEETANRVTVITNVIGLQGGGPIAGLLQTAELLQEELSDLGLNKIDWSSVKYNKDMRLTGHIKRGATFDGVTMRDTQGKITNILCDVGGAEPYALAFDISYERPTA